MMPDRRRHDCDGAWCPQKLRLQKRAEAGMMNGRSLQKRPAGAGRFLEWFDAMLGLSVRDAHFLRSLRNSSMRSRARLMASTE